MKLHVKTEERVTLSVGAPIVITPALPIYDGAVNVTPSSEEQVLHTAGLALVEDITIEPIPSNYGLVTWNGSHLTVS